MRRLSVLLIALVALAWPASSASAQSADGVGWGVTGGVGIAYGTITADATRKMEPTFNGGVFASLPLSERWSFQPEVRYDIRKITISGISTDVTYISVPLLLKNKVWGIYMVQGVALNFLTRADVFDVDFKDVYTSPDVALVIGAGKRFNRVSVEGRWETGFRTFQKDIAVGGVRMRALTAVVSYHIK